VMSDGALVGIVSIRDLVRKRLEDKELEAGVLLDLSRMRA
jgi:CBS domain-containing protein